MKIAVAVYLLAGVVFVIYPFLQVWDRGTKTLHRGFWLGFGYLMAVLIWPWFIYQGWRDYRKEAGK